MSTFSGEVSYVQYGIKTKLLRLCSDRSYWALIYEVVAGKLPGILENICH